MIALQALQEPYHLVQHGPQRDTAVGSDLPFIHIQFDPTSSPIATEAAAAKNCTTVAIPGKSQCESVPASANAKQRPLFMHACGGIKWSLDNLARIYRMPRPIIYVWNYFSIRVEITHTLLRKGSRVLTPLRNYPELDPEPYFWRALERTACWNRAMGSLALCHWTRDHIRDTFCFNDGVWLD